MFPDRLAI